MKPFEVIINELSRFTVGQLEVFVYSVCQTSLASYVGINTSTKSIVSKLLIELKNAGTEEMFLDKISDTAGNMELTHAVNDYFGRIGSGYVDALVVMNCRPFIDRQLLRPALKNLFDTQNNFYRILIVKGSRYTGRSHSHLLIQHLSQTRGFLVKKIDLLDSQLRPLKIEDLILKFANLMEMTTGASILRDNLALASTRSIGLADYIVSWLASNNGGALRHWCFVFDNYDKDEVLPECREFVDNLMNEIVGNNINNAWLVILGRDPDTFPIFPNLKASTLIEEIDPLTPEDIKKYIADFALSKNQLLLDQNLVLLHDAIIDGLKFPLNKEHLGELEARLTNYVRSN